MKYNSCECTRIFYNPITDHYHHSFTTSNACVDLLIIPKFSPLKF